MTIIGYWPLADIQFDAIHVRFRGVQRTFLGRHGMSANDPQRKSHLVPRRTKSVIVLHAYDFMHWHPAFDGFRESYPKRSESPQNYYSRAGDEQNAAPAGV